jgi:hypothetical protein
MGSSFCPLHPKKQILVFDFLGKTNKVKAMTFFNFFDTKCELLIN